MATLREVPWQKKEAMVMADVYDPTYGTLIPYAPRNMLKSIITKLPSLSLNS